MAKLKKTCGIILYIKSIMQLIVTTILFFGGIVLIALGGKTNNSGSSDNLEEQIATCSQSFVFAIFVAIGVVLLIGAVILAIFAIIYLINSRKILHLNDYQKKSTITLLVLEIIYMLISTLGVIISIIDMPNAIFWLIGSLILFIQSTITVILLSKYIKANKE